MRSLLLGVFLIATAAPASAQDDQISETTVKFFEGGYSTPDRKARVYAAQFDKSKTRYVYAELSGTNLQYRKRAQKIPLLFRYHAPDGSIFNTVESNLGLPPEWPGFQSAEAAGWTSAGRWTGGAYRVEILLDGKKKLAEGTFTIYDDVANRPPLASTPAENVKIALQRHAIDDVDGAFIFCQGALDQDGNCVEAFEARASIRLDLWKEYDEAISDCTAAIDRAPTRAIAYHLRGRVHARKGQTSEALRDYDKAIELDPSSAVYYRNRGLTRKALEDYDGALADSERSLKLDPGYADAYNDRALLRRHLGDIDGALEDYGRCLKINPRHSYAFNNRGALHLMRGARYQARLDFEAAIRWGGDSVRASAAESLGAVGLTDAADTLASLLWDDDDTVRRRAVWSMGRLQGRAYTADIGRLLRDRSPDVRSAAAIAIGEVGGKGYAEALESLFDEKFPVVKVHAVLSLCRLGVAKHGATALSLLTDKDEHVRGDAIEALGFLGEAARAKDIAPFLKDPEPDLRVKAVASLGRLGAKEYANDIAGLLNDPSMGSVYNDAKRDWIDEVISVAAARVLRDLGLDPDAMKPQRTPAAPRNIAGSYTLRNESTPDGPSRGEFTIGAVREEGRFDVDSKYWKGKGAIEGDRGYYDWKFLDGTTGRTTFTVDAEGRLHGRVQGSGWDWKYVGKKK